MTIISKMKLSKLCFAIKFRAALRYLPSLEKIHSDLSGSSSFASCGVPSSFDESDFLSFEQHLILAQNELFYCLESSYY